MPSTILSDNGVSSGSAGLKTTAASDGALALQTTTVGGTATTAVTIDTSQNMGLGVTPSAWSQGKAIEVGYLGNAVWSPGGNEIISSQGVYYNGGWKYSGSTAGAVSYYTQITGIHKWFTGPSGSAGAAATLSQAMTLDASGNLGVGTTSPTSNRRLDAVLNTNASAGIRVVNNDAGASASSSTSFSNGTNSHEFGILGTGYTTYAVLAAGDAYIYASSSKNIAFCADGGIIKFGAGTYGVERARIDSSGNLLVGKIVTNDTTVGAVMQSTGRIAGSMAASTNAQDTMTVYSTGASAYRFYVGLGGTVYATSTTISAISDIRFKENVRDLDAGLTEIMALKPRLYDWKEGKGANIKNARGFIAQEFEEVFPDLIDEWKDPAPEGEDPYKSVRADLIPVLVKAIQELNAKFEAYKATHP